MAPTLPALALMALSFVVFLAGLFGLAPLPTGELMAPEVLS